MYDPDYFWKCWIDEKMKKDRSEFRDIDLKPEQLSKSREFLLRGIEETLNLSKKGVSIFILERDPYQKSVLKSFLVSKGYRVEIFQESVIFLKSFLKKKPQLALVNVDFPEQEGWNLVKKLSAQSEKVPVLAMTGEMGKFSLDQVRSLGCVDLVGKPYIPSELVMRIETVLEEV